MKKFRYLGCLLGLLGLLALVSCNGDNNSSVINATPAPSGTENPPPPPPPPPPPTPSKAKLIIIAIQATHVDSHILEADFSRQYQAIGYYSDGTSNDITDNVTWMSSDSSCLSLDQAHSGLVTGVTNNECSAYLRVSLNKISKLKDISNALENNPLVIEVKKLQLLNIKIIAPISDIPVGFVSHYRAIGYYSDGSYSDITNQVSWSSSKPDVATANNDRDKGAIQGLSTDSTTDITVSYKAIITNHITVKVSNISLKGISIVTSNPDLSIMHVNTSSYYKAYGIYSDNSIRDITTSVNWSVSNPKLVTINQQGKLSAVASSNGLDVNIEAEVESSTLEEAIIAKPVKIQISNSPLLALRLNSENGDKLLSGIPNQYKVTARYADGLEDLTNDVYWSVNTHESAIAIISNQLEDKGLLSIIGASSSNANYVTARFGESAVGILSTNFSIVESTIQSLNIVGYPTTLSSAPAGITIAYQAILSYADGTTRDVTKSAYWSSSDSDKVVALSNSGEFRSESRGSAIINLSYVNPVNGAIKESSLSFTVSNNSIVAINIKPDNLIAIANAGELITYNLNANLIDNLGESYPALFGTVNWQSVNNSGLDRLSIDEEANLLASSKSGSGSADIQASLASDIAIESRVHFTLEPAPIMGVLPKLPASSGPLPDITPGQGTLDQVAYISVNDTVFWCPVTDYSNKNQFIAPALIKKSQCYAQLVLGITPNNILKYNKRYNKVYTVAGSNLYIGDAAAFQPIATSYSNMDGGFSFDSGESRIYIPVIASIYALNINQCLLSASGSLVANDCITTVIPIPNTADFNESLPTYAYIVNYKDKYAYIKLAYSSVGQSAWLRCAINEDIITNNCISLNPQTGATNFDHYQHFTKPSLYVTKDLEGILYVNMFSNNMTPSPTTFLAALLDESSGNIPHYFMQQDIWIYTLSPRFTTPAGNDNLSNYKAYDQLSFDDINNWVYFGTNDANEPLMRCSYASGFNDYGKANGGCVVVTAFKDTFAGITFVPGSIAKTPYNPQVIDSNNESSARIFFISQSYGRSDGLYNPYSLVGCNNANNIMESQDCKQYTLKGVGQDSQLAYSKIYKQVYVTSNESVIYSVNPSTHKIAEYPSIISSNALAFNEANNHAYLINGGESQANLYNCKVASNGAITTNCTKITLVAESLGKVTPRGIVNYKDKVLYILLTNQSTYSSMIYKCAINGINGSISACNVEIPLYRNDYLYKISGLGASDFGPNFITFAKLIKFNTQHASDIPIPVDNGYDDFTINPQDMSLQQVEPGLVVYEKYVQLADSFSYTLDNKDVYIGIRQLGIGDNNPRRDIIYPNVDTGLFVMRKCNISINSCSNISSFQPYSSTSLIYIAKGL